MLDAVVLLKIVFHNFGGSSTFSTFSNLVFSSLQVEDCALHSDKRAGDFKAFPTVWKKEVKEGEGYEKPGHFSKAAASAFPEAASGRGSDSAVKGTEYSQLYICCLALWNVRVLERFVSCLARCR